MKDKYLYLKNNSIAIVQDNGSTHFDFHFSKLEVDDEPYFNSEGFLRSRIDLYFKGLVDYSNTMKERSSLRRINKQIGLINLIKKEYNIFSNGVFDEELSAYMNFYVTQNNDILSKKQFFKVLGGEITEKNVKRYIGLLLDDYINSPEVFSMVKDKRVTVDSLIESFKLNIPTDLINFINYMKQDNIACSYYTEEKGGSAMDVLKLKDVGKIYDIKKADNLSYGLRNKH